MGWKTYALLEALHPGHSEDGTPTIVANICPSECTPGTHPALESIELAQLIRPGPGGIWSVVYAGAPALHLAPKDTIGWSRVETAGAVMSAVTFGEYADRPPAGTLTWAGSAFEGRCGTASEVTQAIVWNQVTHFPVGTARDKTCGAGLDPASMMNQTLAGAQGYVYDLMTTPVSSGQALAPHLFDRPTDVLAPMSRGSIPVRTCPKNKLRSLARLGTLSSGNSRRRARRP